MPEHALLPSRVFRSGILATVLTVLSGCHTLTVTPEQSLIQQQRDDVKTILISPANTRQCMSICMMNTDSSKQPLPYSRCHDQCKGEV